MRTLDGEKREGDEAFRFGWEIWAFGIKSPGALCDLGVVGIP